MNDEDTIKAVVEMDAAILAAHRTLQRAESMLSLIRHRGIRAALSKNTVGQPDHNDILGIEVECSAARIALERSGAKP